MRISVTTTFCIVALASSAQALAGAKPASLIKQWTDLNSQCRGGSGDDPKTMEACERREGIGRQIDAAGWCYGKKNQMAYQYQWHACTKGSLRYSD